MTRFLVAFATALLLAPPVLAQHKAGDEHKPKYGGMVKEVNEIQFELVAKPDTLTVYMEDHGKKVDTKGATGKVTLRQGAERSEVALTPAGDNKLEAKGSFKVGSGTKAVATVTLAGKKPINVRFAIK